MKAAVVFCAVIAMMFLSLSGISTAEEESHAGVGIVFDEYGYDSGYDAWGHPSDESEQSEWDGGIGRGEPDVSAIQAAGGDGTGRYD